MTQQNRRNDILLHGPEAIVFPISLEDFLNGHVGFRNSDL